VVLWNQLKLTPIAVIPGFTANIRHMQFNDDESKLFLADVSGRIEVRDLQLKQSIATHSPSQGTVTTFALTPGADQLILVRDRSLESWQWSSSQQLEFSSGECRMANQFKPYPLALIRLTVGFGLTMVVSF
jgi:hypothetical protein